MVPIMFIINEFRLIFINRFISVFLFDTEAIIR
jgi:hypothetical protein